MHLLTHAICPCESSFGKLIASVNILVNINLARILLSSPILYSDEIFILVDSPKVTGARQWLDVTFQAFNRYQRYRSM